jgi:hypothetical protein
MMCLGSAWNSFGTVTVISSTGLPWSETSVTGVKMGRVGGHCKKIGPIIDQLGGELAGRAKVGKVNTDEALDQSPLSCD